MNDTIKLHESWRAPLRDQFASPHMQGLKQFIEAEKAAGKRIFPKGNEYFRALDLTPLDQVKVVVLGQDPYHGAGQAHGLCFSVQPGVRTPPSLVNIYKELESDLGLPRARHGFLELTVEMVRASSHQGKGWETFTDAIVRLVAQKEEPVVFLLWGAYAQRKAGFVDSGRHLVLKAAHPSPLSAHNGFLGCRHFSQANDFLEAKGRGAIDWRLPEPVA